MRIGMVLDAVYPEDGRVTKEATSLIASGYEVYMLCVIRNGERKEEIVNGIKVRRIKRGLSLFWKTFWDSVNALLWSHPKFKSELDYFIKDFKLDVLHVHDLPLAGSVNSAADKAGIPWVLDLHENYPAGLQVWNQHKSNPIIKLKNSLLFNYARWSAYEKRMVKESSKVITVVKEMNDRLVKKHSLNHSKLHIVTNSEWRNFFSQFDSVDEVLHSFPEKYMLLYLGYFGPHRGLDVVIKGLPEILKIIPKAELVIVGKGSYRLQLEKLANTLGVSKKVHFLGLKPYSEVGSWMKRADINIIPHNPNEHTNNTIPHKLFQSMLSGKPTIVSSVPPLARIAAETGGAFVFEAGNPESFFEVVKDVYNDERNASTVAELGYYNTAKGDYNWDTDSRNLIELYNSISDLEK